ncbi:MAG: DUF1460 domain-containing protein [Candidatus Aminicenantes bacterium]|nr:DUF1460 domain-containing protein [Candidatus Aminicenantes bacterium]NIM81794.1 DUF1460 domain-containing protein [Candidatus Aminicenantes bacterium]NIN21166.1 DUF1460 domain-containing protein [Candidatus Aminicenantes bacterium]NIN44990.1 DUF1460 domain-containing protein [Candidatus Aminicenantes bacterium]NIN87804.1 DUF1460 domain-containing protein [Candidatus Aminicenantes bacterium]
MKRKMFFKFTLLIVMCSAAVSACSSLLVPSQKNQPAAKKVLITREHCRFDFGAKWSLEEIDNMLEEAQKITDPGQRMRFITYRFMGTAFEIESLSEILSRGILRVRFRAFDCITFVHYMVALNRSKNFDDFINNLVKLRYKDPETHGIDNCPASGNILDFTAEIYLVNAVKRRFLENITGKILKENGRNPGILNRTIKPLERGEKFGGGLVVPKYESTTYKVPYILPKDIEAVKHSLRTGDLILFIQAAKPSRPPSIFGHGGFVIKGKDLPGDLRKKNNIPADDKNIYFIHSSISRSITYSRLGVCIACKEVMPGFYYPEEPRLLTNYLKGVGFPGVVVLRLMGYLLIPGKTIKNKNRLSYSLDK